jgi:hypothetical protein
MTSRQRSVLRFVVLSLATRRKGENDIGFVLAIDNATSNVPKSEILDKYGG